MSTSLYRVITVLLIGQLASCLDVSISSGVPSTAVPVSQSLVSFSIEQDRWTDWIGTTSRNEFFFNTLDNLKQLTGEPPQIRIGANSEDHTNFGQDVQVNVFTLHGSWTQIKFSFLKPYFPHLLPMFLTQRLQISLWEALTMELPSIFHQVHMHSFCRVFFVSSFFMVLQTLT